MNIIEGGITAPKGFQATGKHIGVKKRKKDISLLISDVPAKVAGCFTKNIVRAAHILWDESIVKTGNPVRGVVTISGNANACTGQQGILDNEEMAETFANLLSAKKSEILTAATGIIGLKMPMDTIKKGINDTYKSLGYSLDDGKKSATAIITTDKFIKQLALTIQIGTTTVTIGGMAKGSGMINPNMATVLSFVTTDINISQKLLQKALNKCIQKTYNMISVDGATSTNDMALVLANGLAQNPEIIEDSPQYYQFESALLYIHEHFAKDIIRDGEGSKKFMEIRITNARSENDAQLIAKSIINDNLVKTAMYSEDANWGRIMAAIGSSGGIFNPDIVNISFESQNGIINLMEKGQPIPIDEKLASYILSEKEIYINIDLNDGTNSATAWGCDLGHEYIRINGKYRSR